MRAIEETELMSNDTLTKRVLTHAGSVWISDVAKNRLFLRMQQATETGLRTGLACPIKDGSQVVGVLEFFAPEAIQPDTRMIEIISLIGAQLGRVVQEKE